jgi:hypothetical protein
MRSRPLDWRGDLKSCRGRLLHEFFHRRNIAIPFILTSATLTSATTNKCKCRPSRLLDFEITGLGFEHRNCKKL